MSIDIPIWVVWALYAVGGIFAIAIFLLGCAGLYALSCMTGKIR